MTALRNLSLAVTLALGVASLVPANADEVITRRTIVTPQSYIVQPQVIAPEVTTTRTTTVTTTPDVLMPTAVVAPVVAPVVTPDSTRTTTIITGSNPVESSTTLMSANIGPFPVFSNRLTAMGEQISTAAARGWMSQYSANALLNERDRLAQIISNRSTSLNESDALERQLNALNLSIQDAMNSAGRTAGLNRFTY